MIDSTGNPILEAYLSQSFLCWGIGPVIAGALGFLLTKIFVEGCFLMGFFNSTNQIQYTKKSDNTRDVLQGLCEEKVSYSTQLQGTLSSVMGVPAIINCITSSFLCPYCIKIDTNLPTIEEFMKHFILMQLIGDLGLYLGHRIQHEIPFLWEFHKKHHTIDTPSVVSVAYIHPIDAFLQAALPIVITAIIIKPHPITYSIYIFSRIAENTINHSGVNHWSINILFMKFLPIKASIQHHDEHHKYSNSNYIKNAKNYGENFIIWDLLFGTLRPQTSFLTAVPDDTKTK